VGVQVAKTTAREKGAPSADRMKFIAEILDTWNMTVAPV
jgi:hypothetical protein